MLISISAWSYRDLFPAGSMDYERFLAEAKRIGADGIEVFPGFLRSADPLRHAQEIADKAEGMGLAVATFITRNDFARPTAAERAQELERMREWIVAAAASGVRRLNTFTGSHTDGGNPLAEYHRVLDAYGEIAPVAEENGVVLCLENMSSVCPDADGILSIIRTVDNPSLRANPDPTNFKYCGVGDTEAMYSETRKLMPYAASFHLHIGKFTADGGNALLDMQRIAALLAEASYDGHVVLEYSGGPDALGACEKGVAMARKWLKSG
jgi:sugar phosphate isomerase/epimerase